MRFKFYIPLVFILSVWVVPLKGQNTDAELYPTARPYTRWWWFASQIKYTDVQAQLVWLKEKGFGGVEIAWVYPLHRYNRWLWPWQDTVRLRQAWLSPEWTEIVHKAKCCADSLGLGCDFTFGTSWPEGDSKVSDADGTRIYGDSTFRQRMTYSWEFPVVGTVINHLDRKAFYRFGNRMAAGLAPALADGRAAWLCESWEIKLNGEQKIWTPGFEKMFYKKFKYNILPYMPKLDSFPDVRYDYMKMLNHLVINEFYKPFVHLSHKHKVHLRGQCLASPTDVMQAYGLMDIPETENMFNEPNYGKIVASAASLAGKRVISCESFTCMYGFPRNLHLEEEPADLKLVADAAFAHGVNQIIWHGTPFNPVGSDSCYFFATVHIGKKGKLLPELHNLNEYMTRVSSFMRAGKTYSDVAVYIPYEDAVMAGPMPPAYRRKWVWGQYELRYVYTPEHLQGRHPLWINQSFLKQARYKRGKLECGDAAFNALYIDVKYIDQTGLRQILKFAQKGLPIYLKQLPTQPGTIRTHRYLRLVEKLRKASSLRTDTLVLKNPPLVSGDTIPKFWTRVLDDGTYHIFFAHPYTRKLSYPMYGGVSYCDTTLSYPIKLNTHNKTIPFTLTFLPYQSILLRISPSGDVVQENIEYLPPTPMIHPKISLKKYF